MTRDGKHYNTNGYAKDSGAYMPPKCGDRAEVVWKHAYRYGQRGTIQSCSHINSGTMCLIEFDLDHVVEMVYPIELRYVRPEDEESARDE